jgi:hypothetical protein
VGALPDPKKSPLRDNKELITDPVFLIGNGASRNVFDLESLKGKGTTIGCNALYRDFAPDVLIVIDAKLMHEIRDTKYYEDHFVVMPNNRSVDIPGAKRWKTDKFNTAGCFAMKLISYWIRPKYCYMLGMDNYAGNVYDGSKNYAVNTLQNFTGVGNAYVKALEFSPGTTFVNVNTQDMWPKECHTTGKYEFMSYKEFKTKALYSNWQRKRV